MALIHEGLNKFLEFIDADETFCTESLGDSVRHHNITAINESVRLDFQELHHATQAKNVTGGISKGDLVTWCRDDGERQVGKADLFYRGRRAHDAGDIYLCKVVLYNHLSGNIWTAGVAPTLVPLEIVRPVTYLTIGDNTVLLRIPVLE